MRKPQAIALGQLTGEPDRVNGPRVTGPHLAALVGGVGPFRQIAGIEVGEEARDGTQRIEVARVDEEPQPVALDRTAARPADIARGDHASRLRESVTDQRLIEVVASGPSASIAVEDRPLKRVAA
jgi:hypothetical protein